jgi:serine/threonine protein kinase/tetratricopeptide (TPR) repeat protein
MRLQPGDLFDRYTIEALLGEGGMGEVYRALDSRLHRRVALKVLRSAKSDAETWGRAVARMLREARAAAALNHPNAVAIYDVGEVDGAPYLAMELIEGASLRRLLGSSVPLGRRLRWLCDVARALSAAHRAGLVHRDIKPENVMVRDDGVLKVLDFGIARAVRLELDTSGPTVDGGIVTVTGRGTFVGTPAYMAPEQVRGDPFDGRADQFAWGVLAFEMLSGKIPFGAGRDAMAIIASILSQETPPLDDVPGEVAAIVYRALEKAPNDRFESMDELIEELEIASAGMDLGNSLTGRVVDGVFVPTPRSSRGGMAGPPSSPSSGRGEAPSPSSRSQPRVGPGGQTTTSKRRSHVGAASEAGAGLGEGTEAGAGDGNRAGDSNRAGDGNGNGTGNRAGDGNGNGTGNDTVSGTGTASLSLAAAPRRRSLWPIAAAASAAAAILAILAVAAARNEPPSPAVALAALSAVPAPPAPTPVTETAPPKTQNAEALAAYREGLQGFRDAARASAHEAFLRAIKLDPTFAAAYLRLTLTSRYRAGTAATRAAFQKAVQFRASLGERDQALLDVLEPCIQREPIDLDEARRRHDAALRRFPGDAELVSLAFFVDTFSTPAQRLEVAERCLALDPAYADCWQTKATALGHLGRHSEAQAALDHCTDAIPAAIDCLNDKANLAMRLGQCERFEKEARNLLAKQPGHPDSYRMLARALFAMGRPEEAARQAIEQAFLYNTSPRRKAEHLDDQTRLASALGRFSEAEKLARALDREVANDPTEEAHLAPTIRLFQIYEETGRAKDAGRVADAMLTRRDAWTRVLGGNIWDDPTLMLAAVKRRAGMLSSEQFEEQRAAFIRAWKKTIPDEAEGAEWLMAYAAIASTAAEAKQALAVAPDLARLQHLLIRSSQLKHIGRLYLLAGRAEEALPLLKSAAASCGVLDDPIRHTQGTYHLGQALAATGDKAGACAAFKVVQGRWGKATESRTARAAAAEAKALRCDGGA